MKNKCYESYHERHIMLHYMSYVDIYICIYNSKLYFKRLCVCIVCMTYKTFKSIAVIMIADLNVKIKYATHTHTHTFFQLTIQIIFGGGVLNSNGMKKLFYVSVCAYLYSMPISFFKIIPKL